MLVVFWREVFVQNRGVECVRVSGRMEEEEEERGSEELQSVAEAAAQKVLNDYKSLPSNGKPLPSQFTVLSGEQVSEALCHLWRVTCCVCRHRGLYSRSKDFRRCR